MLSHKTSVIICLLSVIIGVACFSGKLSLNMSYLALIVYLLLMGVMVADIVIAYTRGREKT